MRMPAVTATRHGRTGGAATAEQRLDDPWQVHSSWSRASPRKTPKSVSKQDTALASPSATISGRKAPPLWSSDGWTTMDDATQDAGWPATTSAVTRNNEWGSTVNLQSKVSDEQQWNVPSGSGDDDDEDEAWKINRTVSVPPVTKTTSPRIGSLERPIPVLQSEGMGGSTTPTHRNHRSGSPDFVTRLRQEHEAKDWQQQQEDDRERDVLQRAVEKRASTPTSTTRPSNAGSSGGRRFARRQQQHEALVNSDEEEASSNGKQRKGLLRFFGGGRKKKVGQDSVSELSEGTGVDEPPQPIRTLRPPSPEKHRIVSPAPKTTQSRSVVDSWNNRKGAASETNDRSAVSPEQQHQARDRFPVQNILGNDKVNKAVPQNGSNEESTVSEVTNPTFFQNENRRSRLMVDSSNQSGNTHALDPFDVNSPIFTAGDPFRSKKQQNTPSSRENAVVTQVKSDEFSDPFFPSAENAVKETVPPTVQTNRLEVDVDHKEEKKEDEVVEGTTVKPSMIRKQGEWFQPSTSSPSSVKYDRAAARRVIERSRSSTPTNHLWKAAMPSPKKSPVSTGRAAASPSSSPVTTQTQVPSAKKSPIPTRRSSASPMSSPVPTRSKPESFQNRASAKFTDRLEERRRRRNSVQERPSEEVAEPEPVEQPKPADPKNTSRPTATRGLSVRDRIATAYREGKYRAPSPNITESPTPLVEPPPPPPPPPPATATKRTKERRKPKKIELVRSTDDDAQPIPDIPKYAATNTVVTNAKKADTYAYMYKKKSSNNVRLDGPRTGKALEVVRSTSGDDNSIANRSSDSNSLSSVGSDLRRLRSILQRSRVTPAAPAPVAQTMSSTFSVFNEESNDPMQRAGLRLLSAAIIPIQCLVRRHLSLRKALTRMWALVVIQSCARRWLVMHRLCQEHAAATRIQAVTRGSIEREKLVLEHCCAIEIQRHVRALLATIHVYEMLYKVTKIQAFARRCLAINEAMDRMVSVIQTQSAARRFLTRCRLARQNEAATKIQARYRSHSARLDYKLNLLDIVIVQSVWRRKSAMILAEERRQIRRIKAAVLIQTQWRSYDCTMNYWHFLADVLISQSAVRRWIARRKVRGLRYSYAKKLQTVVRAYLVRQTHRRKNAAVKIQKVWRGHLGREFTREIQAQQNSATAIQKIWRGFSCYRAFQEELSAIDREISAIYIQKTWRGYIRFRSWQALRHTNAAVKIQKVWRGHLGREFSREIRAQQNSAIAIQKIWRGFLCYRAFQEELAAIDREISAIYIQKTWRGYVCFRSYQEELAAIDREISAIFIQKTWRGYACYKAYQTELAALEAEFAAIHIQKAWRGLTVRRSYERELSANKIQKAWRNYLWYMLLKEEAAAIAIQKTWRGFMGYRTACEERKHRDAATAIQKTWRGFVSYADFMFTLSDIIIVQSLVRGQKARREFAILKSVRRGAAASAIQRMARRARMKNISAAIVIQSYWRKFVAESELFILKVEHGAATKIQSAWRRFWWFSNFIIALDSTITIQAAFRGFKVRNDLVKTVSATILIQTVSRDYLSKRQLRIEKTTNAVVTSAESLSKNEANGTICIQAVARGYLARSVVTIHLKARKLQSQWRAYLVRRSFVEMVAARKIQSRWRAYLIRRSFVEIVAARMIQSYWRGFLVRTAVMMHLKARKIQSVWRCFSIRASYLEFLAVRTIQSAWRGCSARMSYGEFLAARLIQKTWRCYSARESYLEYTAARKIQTVYRAYVVRTAYKGYMAARKIQAAWRCYTAYTVFTKHLAALEIQHLWEVSSNCQAFLEYRSARTIEDAWRRKKARKFFVRLHATVMAETVRSAIVVQRIFRGYKVRCTHRTLTTCLVKLSKEYRAAVVIQRNFRGYLVRMEYWKILGSTIQIQTFLRIWQARERRRWLEKQADEKVLAAVRIQAAFRRWLAQTDFLEVAGAAIVVQMVVRGYLARKEYKQRQFISMLCESASIAAAERKRGGSRSIASVGALPRNTSDLSDWETILARQREVQHAARKIQRFFLLVRAEVDREIRMEKKRRRARKKHKKRKEKTHVEDELLENVWRKTIDPQDFRASDSHIHLAEDAAARELRKSKSSSRHERTSSRSHNSDKTPRSGSATQRSSSAPRRRSVLPPEYRSASPLLVRIHDSSVPKKYDRNSEFSSGNPRLPPSRLATLSRNEMDDDFNLEEAWIDAEINNTRARRLAEKNFKRSKKSSSKKTRSNREQDSSRTQVPSGRPPNYRTCEL